MCRPIQLWGSTSLANSYFMNLLHCIWHGSKTHEFRNAQMSYANTQFACILHIRAFTFTYMHIYTYMHFAN